MTGINFGDTFDAKAEVKKMLEAVATLFGGNALKYEEYPKNLLMYYEGFLSGNYARGRMDLLEELGVNPLGPGDVASIRSLESLKALMQRERELGMILFREVILEHGGWRSEKCLKEKDDECGYCAIIDCPEFESLHYHHDGCPCCDTKDEPND